MTPETLVKSTFPPETKATTFLSSSHLLFIFPLKIAAVGNAPAPSVIILPPH